MATGSLIPSLQTQATERSSRLLQRAVPGRRTQGQRQLLAQAAVQASLAGEPADRVLELAGNAWDGGQLLGQEGADGVAWTLVSNAYCLAGDLECAITVAEAALEDAHRASSPQAYATASYARGLPRFWQGRVAQALGDLEPALDARRFGWRQFARAAVAHYALCLIETGDADRAEELLIQAMPRTPTDVEDAILLYVLAELRRSQGQLVEALELALRAGALAEQSVLWHSMRIRVLWRGSTAQWPALALGR